MKPSQAARDFQGRVNLEDLTEGDLDYGTEERGLASLRCRLSHTVYMFNGPLCTIPESHLSERKIDCCQFFYGTLTFIFTWQKTSLAVWFYMTDHVY